MFGEWKKREGESGGPVDNVYLETSPGIENFGSFKDWEFQPVWA